ncbi:serine/threonine-protein kinase [Micromonospora sp. DT233]|uniref:serine/threonine-protein kinase n=1 Tax=Micromonospora sp. DT233 TaxID=3393432 RepID=UPI003CEFC39A
MNGESWRVSGYTEVRQLGSSTSGRVVLATQYTTGTPVAVKYLVDDLGGDPSFRDFFRSEARRLADIDDPHVCQLYEYVESPVGAAVVTELVDGVPLRQLLRAGWPIGPEAALSVFKNSLAALAAAHERGALHRAYKPENVLVTAQGWSKLADFGIAGPVGQEFAGTVTGLPRYLAPEQWTGAAASPAGDIYAATATLFECLTGRPPYDGRSLPTLRDQHAHAPVRTDPAPQPLHDLLRRGMAKRSDERAQSAQLLLAELEEVAAEAYGADWEEYGRSELARRAALLVAFFPFSEPPAGSTGQAGAVRVPQKRSTAGREIRMGRRARTGLGRPVLVGGALVTVVLLGGVGYRYAATDEPDPATPMEAAGPLAVVADPRPSSVAPPPPASPTPSATPSPSAVAATSASATAAASSRPPSPTARPTTAAPSPTPRATASAGGTPTPSPPPADVTAPTVGAPAARSSTLTPRGCPYGVTSTPVTVTVTDDRSAAAGLRVTLRYTVGQQPATVGMSSVGGGGFQATLGPFDQPAETAQIALHVSAVDAAGNSAGPVGPAYVSLRSTCAAD